MSDGPSDCAYEAETKAEQLVKHKWPDAVRIHSAEAAPKRGTCVYLYEAWLTHVVEIIANRLVAQRWRCEPFKAPSRMRITNDDWPVGYYHNHRLPREVAA